MPWENHYPADASQMSDHIKNKGVMTLEAFKMLIISTKKTKTHEPSRAKFLQLSSSIL